jgi:hypothetical protein
LGIHPLARKVAGRAASPEATACTRSLEFGFTSWRRSRKVRCFLRILDHKGTHELFIWRTFGDWPYQSFIGYPNARWKICDFLARIL